MRAAKQLIDTYAEQELSEAEETLATVAEFFVECGAADEAVSTLCDWIDDEQLTSELTNFLQQRGISIEEES